MKWFLEKEVTVTSENNRRFKNVFCFSAQSTDTDVINPILLDATDIDPRNADQGPLPLMIAGLTGKGRAWEKTACGDTSLIIAVCHSKL